MDKKELETKFKEDLKDMIENETSRLVVELYLSGYTPSEISDKLGIDINEVNVIVSVYLSTVKNFLEDQQAKGMLISYLFSKYNNLEKKMWELADENPRAKPRMLENLRMLYKDEVDFILKTGLVETVEKDEAKEIVINFWQSAQKFLSEEPEDRED